MLKSTREDQYLSTVVSTYKHLGRAQPDVTSGPEVRQIVKIRTVQKLVVVLTEHSTIPPKEFLQKKTSQKKPSQKFLLKKSSKKIPPKNSSQKIPKKFPKKIQKVSKYFLKKFQRF